MVTAKEIMTKVKVYRSPRTQKKEKDGSLLRGGCRNFDAVYVGHHG